jgi:hypothetical protein
MTSVFTTTWTLFAGVIVLFLPGFAWLALFWDPAQDAFERLAESIGVSISITALFALLAFILGWQITSSVLIVIYLLMAPPAVWSLRRWWRGSRQGEKAPNNSDDDVTDPETLLVVINSWFSKRELVIRYLILALIIFAALIWRFYQIRDVVLPLWVDSVHHVQIVKMILENGGIPDTFEPYMPVPFYYHFAFHALAAGFSFITRLNPQDGVLYLGQVLNAAIALAVYRLGKALWGDWRRAALAAILIAFVTQMPAYYVTWGRYTLLTGTLLLPLAMALALDIVNKGAKFSRVLTLGMITAGIFLSHYFAAALFGLFLLVLGAQALFSGIKNQEQFGWSTWSPLLLASLAGLLLASPWLYRVWEFTQERVNVVAIPTTLDAVDRIYFPRYWGYLWLLLGPDRNHAVLFMALPGLIISLFRKRTRAFGIWSIMLIILSQPIGIQVSPFRPDHAAIVLFLPTVILVAELFVSAIDWSPIEKINLLKTVAVLIIFTALVGWGIWGTRSVINSATILATKADLEAINWIEDNLPPEARFVINVAFWQYGAYRGVDGGWWITPLTDRETSLPNALSGMGNREYAEQVNAVAAQFGQIKGCSPRFWDLVREEGLTHMYLTRGKGSIQPSHFNDCPGVELLFENQGVYIYHIEDIIDSNS